MPGGLAISRRAMDSWLAGEAVAAGATFLRSHPALTCGYYAYWSDVPVDGVEFYIREGRDVLVFPTHDGQTCVWVGRSSDEWPDYRANVEARYLGGLDEATRARLDAGRRMSPFRGTHKLPNHFRQCHGEGWALVGDAAYHRDPLTGMGIGDAFLGAELLACAFDDKGLLNPGKVIPTLHRCAEYGKMLVRGGQISHPELPRF